MITIRNTEWEHPSPASLGAFGAGHEAVVGCQPGWETGFVVMMKDGLFYRNTVAR